MSTRHSLDLLGVEPWRRVEDRDAVAHQLAVGDHRLLDGLDAFQVDHALLVHGHQVRHGEHRHFVDRLKTAEARPVGRVADVVVRRQAHRLGAIGAGQADLAARRDALERAGAADLLDLDQLRLLLDHRHDVVLAALGGDVVVRLGVLARSRDGQFESVVAQRRRLSDLDRDLVTDRARTRARSCGSRTACRRRAWRSRRARWAWARRRRCARRRPSRLR